MWKAVPNIQIFVTSKFGQIDILDPNVTLSSHFPKDYILKRLVRIHSKQPFDKKRCIMTKSAASSSPTIVDTYLILIPITVTNDGEQINRTSEYIDPNDLIYIIDLMRPIENEEHDEKVAMVKNINSSLLNNEDMDSSSSSPSIAREFRMVNDIPIERQTNI